MLGPCTQCNRHIDERELTCPFCGAANETRPRTIALPSGRLSRAAVFASSVLVAPACVVNDAPPPQYPQYQQPPPDYQQPPPPNDQQPPPPPDDQPPPPDDQTYAQPPPDDRHETDQPPPVVHNAGVHIVVRFNDGRPYVGPVQLHGPTSHAAQTNAMGELIVKNLPPGLYTITVQNYSRRQPLTQQVELRNNAVSRVHLTTFSPSPYYPHHSPKPYGAPPARKRVV